MRVVVAAALLFIGAAWLVAIALITGFLTLYSMSVFWTQAFWRPRTREGHRARPIPPAMVAGVAVMAACTLGLGLAIEPAIRLSRTAASKLTTNAVAPNAVSPVGTVRTPR
jgi:multicomponent Na+:H+ antiporter subunit D